MLRRLLKVAAAGFCLVSLLASLGLGWLWWRSWRVRDAREFTWRGVRWEGASDAGRGWLTNGPQQRIERAPVDEAERQVAEAGRRVEEELHEFLEADARTRAAEAHQTAFLDAYDAHQNFTEAELGQWEAERALTRARSAVAAIPKTNPYSRSVPYAAPIAATACPPLLWLAARGRRRWVVRRRRRLGLCPRCGYDLRGSPPGGRCSECGGTNGAQT